MSEQPDTKGRGVLYFTVGLWHSLGEPETPLAWHKALLLPANFEIVDISLQDGDRYRLIVTNDAIPVIHGDVPLPILMLWYTRRENDVILEKIDVDGYFGDEWKYRVLYEEVQP